ncbi:tetratricopeptide repeat-containing protein kinase family protein [Streptomyces microflavus]|uniref:tetratricopeptide repeat-containing protein kinase family protein n=1 Tax=Streptomyces microflavus TaxID=1919 RepID=UPI00344DBC2B
MAEILAESGAELSQEEMLDALWLAGKLPRDVRPLQGAADGLGAPAKQHGTPHPDRPSSPNEDAEPVRTPTGPAEAEEQKSRSTRPLLATAQDQAREDAQAEGTGSSSAAMPVGTPDTGLVVAGQLQFGKSLRPLRQRLPDRRRRELDIPRTVDAIADTGVPETITRAVRTRWLSLALVVDDGISMVLWQRLAAEVRALMTSAGAFRDVRVYGLDTRGGEPRLRTSPYRHRSPLQSPRTLCDPTGNTLVLVVSDGVGEAWWDGGMRRVVDSWARCGPTAIVQALPPRLWASTGIGARRWQVSTRRRGGPTQAWHITDPDLPPDLVSFHSVPVPVLEPTPAAVGEWARLIASPGGTAMLKLWDNVPAVSTGPAADIRRSDAAEAVLRFRDSASPEAYRLAAHVAAVAPLTPPVMRMVQAALGHPTDRGHLTEVFLGGLMHEVDADEDDRLPHHRRFDFSPDTCRILLSTVSPKELLRTAEAVARGIEVGVGRAPTFPAWVGHPDGVARVEDTGRSFGRLREQLLERLGVPPAGGGRPEPHEPDTSASTRPPTGWVELLPGDPERLGRFELRARSGQGWPHMAMYLARDEDGTSVTVRAPSPLHADAPGAALDLVRTEAECLLRMGGRFAPALVDMRQGSAEELPWVAAECIHHRPGDDSSPPAPNLGAVLYAYKGSIPHELFLEIGLSLSQALAHAHGLGIVHGSLAPRAVLVTDDGVRLVGWATATLDGVDSAHREVLPFGEAYLEADDHGLFLTSQSDMYSAGALLFAFHAGRWAGEGARAGRRMSYPLSGIDPALHRVLRRCLEAEPARRPSAAVLAEAFAAASTAPAAVGASVRTLEGMAGTIRRLHRLAQLDPRKHGPALGENLMSFSDRLERNGRTDESLVAIEEAVVVYRDLAEQGGRGHSVALWGALSNLSVRLSKDGRHRESLDAVSEAEAGYRQLSQEGLDVRAGHAMVLNNLSNCLAAEGREIEALQAVDEAVEIGRLLARSGSAVHLADLARSLTSRGRRLAALGRRTEAVEAGSEAVRMYRALPPDQGGQVVQDYAVSLNNLAVLLGELGRHGQALRRVEESVEAQRRLGREAPGVVRGLRERSEHIRMWLTDVTSAVPER